MSKPEERTQAARDERDRALDERDQAIIARDTETARAVWLEAKIGDLLALVQASHRIFDFWLEYGEPPRGIMRAHSMILHYMMDRLGMGFEKATPHVLSAVLSEFSDPRDGNLDMEAKALRLLRKVARIGNGQPLDETTKAEIDEFLRPRGFDAE